MSPSNETPLHLRIIQINDVYLLDNFPHFTTLVREYAKRGVNESAPPPDKTIVVLAGDFVAPSILSSLDRGRGMVDVMNASGITHVCLGNHEADISVSDLKGRIQESTFKWINTNMRGLDEKIKPVTTPSYDLVEVSSKTRREKKSVALLGLLTEDDELYNKGAFGGAKIEPIVSSAEGALKKLGWIQNENGHELNAGGASSSTAWPVEKPDLVVPMTHQSMPKDREFCKHFGGDVFPVVIGGHDHEPYDETHRGSRLLKTGMDGRLAAVIDVLWKNEIDANQLPEIRCKMIETKSFKADPHVTERVKSHYKILEELEKTRLFHMPPCCDLAQKGLMGITTKNNRLKPTSGSTLLVTAMRKGARAECACFNAGGIRGNKDYGTQEWFMWSDLKEEIPFTGPVTWARIPGRVLSDTIAYSRRGSFKDPPVSSGGYLQACDMIVFDSDKKEIDTIRGEAFDPERIYLAAIPADLVRGVDNNIPLLTWVEQQGNKEILFERERPAKIVIAEFFVATLWLDLGSFTEMDANNDGVLTADEIKQRVAKVFGKTDIADLLVSNLMAVADLDNDGVVDPVEMLSTAFLATDMLSHVNTEKELDVMTKLAGDVLNVSPDDDKAKSLAGKLVNMLDENKDGKITREEAIQSLGRLKAESMLQ